MRILVLGGNGFIGSHLVDRLLAEGHRVRVFDRYQEIYRAPLADVEYCMADFGNRGLLANALLGVEIVYHLISTTLPKTSNDDPVFDVSSNVIESLFFLEECVKSKVRKVVFISSGGTVYGNPAILPIPEDAPTNPECSYGITKLTIEKYLALYQSRYGLDYTIVRPSNPYGSRQNPSGIQGAIPVFLANAHKGEPIRIWGDGEVVRDYLYIDDLIDAMYRVINTDSAEKVFNIGSGRGSSLNEIVGILKKVTNRDITVRYEDRRNFDVPINYLDIEKARKILAWAPKTDLEDGMGRVWEFIKQFPN